MRLSKLMIPIMAIAMATLVACTGCAANPFKAARGADEQAYAVLGSYVIYQRQALLIVQDVTLPSEVRRVVANADAVAFPVLKAVDTMLVDFLNAKAALDAGTGSEDKVRIATNNLQDWVAQGREALVTLKDAVLNARKVLAYQPRNELKLAWSV